MSEASAPLSRWGLGALVVCAGCARPAAESPLESSTSPDHLVAPAQVVPAAPAPLQSIRDEVKADWIHQEALRQAQAFAKAVAAKANIKIE